MQETGAQTITLEMLTTSLKLGGVEFSEDERKQMVATANQNLTEQIRCDLANKTIQGVNCDRQPAFSLAC